MVRNRGIISRFRCGRVRINFLIFCYFRTIKSKGLNAVPPGVIAVTLPVVAPAGTTVFNIVGETLVNLAGLPLKATEDASNKLEPDITTGVPIFPLLGMRLKILGMTLKTSLLVADPYFVMTFMYPVEAILGTIAVMDAGEETLKGV